MAHHESAVVPSVRDTDAVVAVYPTHEAAEDAVVALQRAGFDMARLSIVGRDYHTEEHVVGYYNRGDRIRFWGKRGAFWGALFGILMAPALLFVPVFGHLIILGPLAGVLAGALEGGVLVGATSALAAALVGIGVPENSVLRYEEAIKADKFLVVAHGTADEAARARELLAATAADDVAHHRAAADEAARVA